MQIKWDGAETLTVNKLTLRTSLEVVFKHQALQNTELATWSQPRGHTSIAILEPWPRASGNAVEICSVNVSH